MIIIIYFSSLESKYKEFENIEIIISENKITQNNLNNIVLELEEKYKNNEIEIQK